MFDEFMEAYNGVGTEEKDSLLRLVMLYAHGSQEQVEAFDGIMQPVLDGVKDTGGKPPAVALREALDAVGA